jgi:S-adenosylmethionine:tRNA ribosyltransferase-isomerase
MMELFMRTADFDYELPPELIAQTPVTERDKSRLLVLRRQSGAIEHRTFRDLLGFVHGGDVLVMNNSRVIPARLRAVNPRTEGKMELLLLEENGTNDWWAMLRPGKRARVGTQFTLLDHRGQPTAMHATVLEINEEGHRRLRFTGAPDVLSTLDDIGEIPLPPYINRDDAGPMETDRERYQTVFARPPGSVAAPTAGLHFTEPLLDELRAKSVQIVFLTLHVGLGTFAPVKAETITSHTMHEERYELPEQTAAAVNAAKREGGRVIAVGTTTLRALESAADTQGCVTAGRGKTRIFIHPPRDFQVVNALLTNFHLPRSTLLMLVSAFAAPNQTHGREMILSAYAEAIQHRYRFFSYGDAMFIC